MALLAPLFGTDFSYWKPLTIIYPALMVVCGLWIYVDANSRVGNGCFWGALAFAVPPLGVPLYYGALLAMALRDARGPGAQERREREQREQLRKQLVTQGEIQRQQYLEQAQAHGGTVFNPQAGMGQREGGCRHFVDQHAEELIEGRRYEEASDYLIDMYALARNEQDGVRMDTYRYYLCRLPDGQKRLRDHLGM